MFGAARTLCVRILFALVLAGLATEWVSAATCSGEPLPRTGEAGRGVVAANSWANVDFFTNYGQYMPRVHCLHTAEGRPDWPWIAALIVLTCGIIAGYLCIYTFWRRCYLAEEHRDRNEKLMQLAFIFVMCAVCGYGFSILMFFWPAYRLLAIVMVPFNFLTWKFVSNLKPFELSFHAPRLQRQLNESLAAEKEELEAKNQELIKARDELKESVVELAETNRELDDFTYAASHDLKSPLRAIGNLAEFISEELEDTTNEQVKADLAQLKGRASRLERLLTGMLEYSRVTRREHKAEACHARELVEEIKSVLNVPEGFQIRHDGFNKPFRTEVTPLRQVLHNLIDNAIKHHNGSEGLIEVVVCDRGYALEFRVADDGPGIPLEYQQRVFGMFETLKRRDEVESSGIGLALVKRIVENHGGRIWVESELGCGSTFHFTWPIELEGEHDEETTMADEAACEELVETC